MTSETRAICIEEVDSELVLFRVDFGRETAALYGHALILRVYAGVTC